jgi:putative membrane protein
MHSDYRDVQVPTKMHGLIGIVMGLLLVFRTNTSYERWWEGRKSIQTVANVTAFLSLKVDTCMKADVASAIKMNLRKFVTGFKKNLEAQTKSLHEIYYKSQMDEIGRIMFKVRLAEIAGDITSRDAGSIETSLANLVDASGACDRIKSTPIPIAYAMHVKICLFVYLLSLPFGLFRDLGLASSLMVMLIFYIAAGIEIISDEIENPFAGDPNDLPVDQLTRDIIKNIEID